MTLAEMKDLVAYQSASMGSDEGFYDLDTPAQALIIHYINEGYSKLVNEYYRPLAIEQVTLDAAGALNPSSLAHDLYELKKVALSKEQLIGAARCVPSLNPLEQSASSGELFSLSLPNQTVWVQYQYRLPPLHNETDAPQLPSENHMLIGDYATWRYMSTGNSEKQSRARAFLERFYDGAPKIRPYGQVEAALSKFIF